MSMIIHHNNLLINASRSPLGSVLPTLQAQLISTAGLPGTQNEVNNVIHSLTMLHHREDSRAALSHLGRIALHNLQIGTNNLGQIDLVDNQQVRAGDTRSALSGHLVTSSDIDNVDDEIGQLTRVVGGEVVTTRLDEEEVGLELLLQGLQSEQVGADILTDGSVRTTTCFDGADSAGRQGLVASEELGVFSVWQQDSAVSRNSMARKETKKE